MKNINRTALVILITAVTALYTNAKAQTAYKTDETLSSQLKNGTVPGLKYAPVTTALRPQPPTAKSDRKESFNTQLKKGTVPGMQYQRGGAATVKKAVAKAPAAGGALASGKVMPKPGSNKAAKIVAVPIPSQGENAPVKTN